MNQKNESIVRVEFPDIAGGFVVEFLPSRLDRELIDAMVEEIRIGKLRSKLEEIYRRSKLRKKGEVN